MVISIYKFIYVYICMYLYMYRYMCICRHTRTSSSVSFTHIHAYELQSPVTPGDIDPTENLSLRRQKESYAHHYHVGGNTARFSTRALAQAAFCLQLHVSALSKEDLAQMMVVVFGTARGAEIMASYMIPWLSFQIVVLQTRNSALFRAPRASGKEDHPATPEIAHLRDVASVCFGEQRDPRFLSTVL